MDLRATISADIVASTSLSVDSMLSLNESIKSCIVDIEEHFPGTWGRLVKGDSIEFVADSPRMALRIALILKAYVKSLSLEKSPEAEQFRRSVIRLAIGIGPMRLIDKDKDFMDEVKREPSSYAARYRGKRITRQDTEFFQFYFPLIRSGLPADADKD